MRYHCIVSVIRSFVHHHPDPDPPEDHPEPPLGFQPPLEPPDDQPDPPDGHPDPPEDQPDPPPDFHPDPEPPDDQPPWPPPPVMENSVS